MLIGGTDCPERTDGRTVALAMSAGPRAAGLGQLGRGGVRRLGGASPHPQPLARLRRPQLVPVVRTRSSVKCSVAPDLRGKGPSDRPAERGLPAGALNALHIARRLSNLPVWGSHLSEWHAAEFAEQTQHIAMPTFRPQAGSGMPIAAIQRVTTPIPDLRRVRYGNEQDHRH